MSNLAISNPLLWSPRSGPWWRLPKRLSSLLHAVSHLGTRNGHLIYDPSGHLATTCVTPASYRCHCWPEGTKDYPRARITFSGVSFKLNQCLYWWDYQGGPETFWLRSPNGLGTFDLTEEPLEYPQYPDLGQCHYYGFGTGPWFDEYVYSQDCDGNPDWSANLVRVDLTVTDDYGYYGVNNDYGITTRTYRVEVTLFGENPPAGYRGHLSLGYPLWFGERVLTVNAPDYYTSRNTCTSQSIPGTIASIWDGTSCAGYCHMGSAGSCSLTWLSSRAPTL